MSEYNVLKIVSRFIFPYILIFGLYIIINGDVSPGGGFQGGVVLASSYFLIYFIKEEQILNIKEILTYEKILFLILIIFCILLFSNYILPKVIYNNRLVILNLIIGAKVSLGVGGIIGVFLEEGQL